MGRGARASRVRLAVRGCLGAGAAGRRRQLASTVPACRDWLSDESILALEGHLLNELSRLGELALLEDFRAETQNSPQPASSEGYWSYIRDLLASRYEDLFGAFPVLARQVVLLADQWVDQTAALVSRVQEDRAAIESTFGSAAGQVRRLTPGLSDRHAGGCRVALVEFASGLRLAYKPRDVRLERVFNELLGWLRQSGLAVVPRPLRVIDRGTHGWVEWVEQESLGSSEAVHAYFRSAGALVCLAHVLGGTDLHSENLIASADGPVLVDTEMLLQPSTRPSADARGRRGLGRRVVRLLPRVRAREPDGRRPEREGVRRRRSAAGGLSRAGGADAPVAQPAARRHRGSCRSIGFTRCCVTTSG